MSIAVSNYDPADDLRSFEAPAYFMRNAFQTRDVRYIAHASRVVVRAIVKWRKLPLICLVFLALDHTAPLHSQTPNSIREIDFRNFTYPWIHPNRWPNHLQWMSLNLNKSVYVKDGTWDERSKSEIEDNLPFSGLTFESVQYAHLANRETDDAIVDLIYHSGGTQHHHWVYIYGMEGGKPKLAAYFHAGDRANQGLYKIYGMGGELVVELLDPDRQTADCCSTGFLRHRFRWNGSGFQEIGKAQKGLLELDFR